MRRVKTRALGLALGAVTLTGAGIAALGATGASAATVDRGGHVQGFVYTTTNAVTGSSRDGSLRLRDVVASGGTDPISVAIAGSLVEVLNAGAPPT